MLGVNAGVRMNIGLNPITRLLETVEHRFATTVDVVISHCHDHDTVVRTILAFKLRQGDSLQSGNASLPDIFIRYRQPHDLVSIILCEIRIENVRSNCIPSKDHLFHQVSPSMASPNPVFPYSLPLYSI